MSAFLALWNDYERGREAEYDAWHTREHVPERVSAPGFRTGRRYACADHPAHRWFTLYEVEGLHAFATPEYRDLLDNPTPWSARMRAGFRHMLRVPCHEAAAVGLGLGAALAVLRLPADASPALQEIAAAPGVVRARLGDRAERGGAPSWQGGGSGASDDFDRVLLVEALDRAAAGRAFAAASALLPAGAVPLEHGGIYDLAFLFPADPAERAGHRRPGWG
jgi:hypothetical protein